MKRIVFLMLALFALSFCVFAEEPLTEENTDLRVEIEFCVGDATLIINGQEVVVEKPYVVGEGVTLVPVRVITEAFGAKVGWIKETKTITLEYPDVNIVLQIGNTTAEVNGRAETLLSAPELTQNGFTMVPLRFISESFGAEVGYDNETKRITVVKESAEEGTTVEGAIENKYVGDSYYGWSMENPKDMYLDDRDFDGMNTYFLDEDFCWIDVCIFNKDEDFDFDDEFDYWKDALSEYTLVKADRDSSDSKHMTIHLQAKDKEIFRDVYLVITEKYIYLVDGGFDIANCDNIEEYKRIISTFEVNFNREDIYDLSNIKDGMRTFENKEMKFTLDVPENFTLASNPDALNNFSFRTNDGLDSLAVISGGIYSKDTIGSAEETAKRECEKANKYFSPEFCKISDVSSMEYEGFTAYEYSMEIKTDEVSALARDVYFELGDYLYVLTCIIDVEENEKEYIDKIVNSFKAEQLDFDEVGVLMYLDEEREGTTTIDEIGKCSFEIPKNFKKVYVDETMGVFQVSSNMGTFAVIAQTNQNYTKAMLSEFVDLLELQIKRNEDSEIIVSPQSSSIGGKTFRHMSYTTKTEKLVSVCDVYIIVEDGILYVFESSIPEIAYSDLVKQEIKEAIRTLSFE